MNERKRGGKAGKCTGRGGGSNMNAFVSELSRNRATAHSISTCMNSLIGLSKLLSPPVAVANERIGANDSLGSLASAVTVCIAAVAVVEAADICKPLMIATEGERDLTTSTPKRPCLRCDTRRKGWQTK